MSKTVQSLLASLNTSQKKAALHTNGPLLVLAGAGSGKTRVLTTRIARLVGEKKCAPENILALTFTNKAAREMRERIADVVSQKSVEKMAISTFHSFGASILRAHADRCGLSKNFTILDDHERQETLRGVLRGMGKASKEASPEEFGSSISRAKNASDNPLEFLEKNEGATKIQKAYNHYLTVCRKRNSVDFDDLLLKPLLLFKEQPDVLAEYRKRFQFISIDEFQDTNNVQMQLAMLLCTPRNNIMVVGDDDQSIYSWRGANIDNILRFADRFEKCTTVVLDKNYRSTSEIVNGAYAVIGKNRHRMEKNIIAQAGNGTPIMHYKADDELEEAEWVANTIVDHVNTKLFSYSDHAMLFRTNQLMCRFEEELRRKRIPYKTVGSMSFFDRKEVKDIFAYLRFFANPADESSLLRMLKVPDKGISPSSLAEIDAIAASRKTALWEIFTRPHLFEHISEIQRGKIASLVSFCKTCFNGYEAGSLSVTTRRMLVECGYIGHLKKNADSAEATEADKMRIENVEEIIHGLELFETQSPGKGKPDLGRYLQEITMAYSEDTTDEKKSTGVTLMTLHKSKGLEFPVVFLVGLDNAIFPSPKAIAEGGIEEERRLFYVGMTRAKKRLFLTYPATKLFRKQQQKVTPCAFIREIPEQYLDGAIGKKADGEYKDFVTDFVTMMQEQLSK